METLFLAVLNMSLTASYVIPFVLLARLLLKNVPSIYRYCLWSVVFFRLLCPFSLESAVSLLPQKVEPITTNTFITEYREMEKNITVPSVPSVSTDIISTAPTKPSTEFKNEAVNEQNDLNTGINWTFMAQILWISGMFVMMILSTVSLLRLKKRLIVTKELEKGVFFADDITSPFVFGVISPKIYLPSSINQEEIPLILAHERFHLKRFDHVTRLLSFVALTLHWFNPLVWISYYLSENDMETSCDEGVLREKSLGERGDYATALLKFTGKRTSLTPLAFSENDTKGRVKNIMKMKKTKLWASGLAGLLVVGLIVGFSTSQKQQEIIGVLPEKLDPLMLTYYSNRGGVEETLVYRLWDNETAQNELVQLLGSQAYFLWEAEEDPEKMQEMLNADTEQIMLWGEYGDEVGGILMFDLPIGESTLLLGNNLGTMNRGLGEFENQERLLHAMFEFFEENKEILHQLEVTPEKPLGEEVALLGSLNGLTYELVHNMLPVPMLQILGASTFAYTTESGEVVNVTLRIQENDVYNFDLLLETGENTKEYPFYDYETLDKESLMGQFVAQIYFNETGFVTEESYFPFVSAKGDEYFYQIEVNDWANTQNYTGPTDCYVNASFLLGDYEISINYSPKDFESAVEMTETIFSFVNTFEIAPDGFHSNDILWSEYQYVSK